METGDGLFDTVYVTQSKDLCNAVMINDDDSNGSR
jgi:hypothetical protein